MPYLNLTQLASTSNAFFFNTSYNIAAQPVGMTTPLVWITFSIFGILLLLFSRSTAEPTCRDLAGVISSILLLISAIQSFAVDTITGIATAGGTDAPVLGAMVELHTVYHYDLIGLALGIVWVISIANLYLLWLDHNRITEQERIPVDARMPKRQENTKQVKEDEDED